MANEGQDTSSKPEAPAASKVDTTVPPANDVQANEPVVEEIPPHEGVKPEEKKDAKEKGPRKKRRVWVWLLAIILILGVSGVAAWQFGWYKPVYDKVYAASVSFKVREDDKYALEGVSLAFRDKTYTTDASGQVNITGAVAGDWPISIAKDGYVPYTATVTLKRGDNGSLSVSLKKETAKVYSVKGLVTDYVSALALSEVQVSLGGKSAKTAADGSFTVDDLVAGEFKLTLSKAGFTTVEVPLTVSPTTDVAKVSMVPTGNVLYVSNRDGKRSMYVAKYDGSGERQLVAPVAGTEDFGPSVSPDGKRVVFSSTRDKIPSTFNGRYLSRLYVVDIDGKNLKKVSDDVSPAAVTWSANSGFIYFEAYKDSKLSEYVRRFYDVSKANTFELGETSSGAYMMGTATKAIYSVSRNTEGYNYVYDIKSVDFVSGERRTIISDIEDLLTSEPMEFVSDDTAFTYETQDGNGRKRYQADFQSGEKKEISLKQDAERAYSVSPDGTRKAFIETRDGKNDIYTVNNAGVDERRITTFGVVSALAPITWDTTSRYITFAVVREGENGIYIVSAAGGEVRKIVDFTPDSEPVPYY
ncbi:MAG TPA: carboxypeptidase regulatory-like domain-containing protein [Verrucomicrobiae bacterium]|nr:carboxypeptidase regulatory-like domain-containing protein [Verrucomicrobiae bacterium]